MGELRDKKPVEVSVVSLWLQMKDGWSKLVTGVRIGSRLTRSNGSLRHQSRHHQSATL